MPAYLKLGEIKGDTRDARFRDQIALIAYSWGPPGTKIKKPKTGEKSLPVNEVTMTKYLDRSTEPLYTARIHGTRFRNAVLTPVGKEPPGSAFAVYSMTNVIVGACKTSHRKRDGRLLQEFTLFFTHVFLMSEAEFLTLQSMVRTYERGQQPRETER